MSLLTVLGRLVAVDLVALVVATLVIVGPARLRATKRRGLDHLRAVAPYLALLGVVLAVNSVARQVGPEVSWMVGWNITGLIYSIEGGLVAVVQSVATPTLTAYFSTIYIYGYVFLLVFPFVAYAALEDLRPLRRTAVAYSANYVLGLACYLLFIAYGPRNLIPDLVDPLLYATYPQTQILTGEVNTNTNVFPSLHTSLSVTVGMLAWRTREVYPGWLVVAAPLAFSVVISTMYLGIHWGTDVVAGVLLAVGSVAIADRFVDQNRRRRPFGTVDRSSS
ncbi:phosphatase PAP2 family protein [Halobacteriaceae archaeon GCM10025711]